MPSEYSRAFQSVSCSPGVCGRTELECGGRHLKQRCCTDSVKGTAACALNNRNIVIVVCPVNLGSPTRICSCRTGCDTQLMEAVNILSANCRNLCQKSHSSNPNSVKSEHTDMAQCDLQLPRTSLCPTSITNKYLYTHLEILEKNSRSENHEVLRFLQYQSNPVVIVCTSIANRNIHYAILAVEYSDECGYRTHH